MFNIYDELRNGASAESLVAQFTEQLNEAEARIKEEEEAARREAEAQASNDAKTADFAHAVEVFCTALQTHYPDFATDEALSDADYNEVAQMITGLLDIEALRFKVLKPKKVKVEAKKPQATKSTDDIFADFFKSFGF